MPKTAMIAILCFTVTFINGSFCAFHTALFINSMKKIVLTKNVNKIEFQFVYGALVFLCN